MLGDDEEEDKMLLEREYFSDQDNKFFEDLEEIINGDCRAVVLNGKDILYNSYDGNRSEEEKAKRRKLSADIYTNLLQGLIQSREDFFFDIYLFPDQWHEGKNIEFGPRKYHIEYNANTKKFNVSIFTKSKELF